jgi:hypothetical protein
MSKRKTRKEAASKLAAALPDAARSVVFDTNNVIVGELPDRWLASM